MLKQKNLKQLSYDEFKQMAEHPQHRDVPAVFKLEVLETVELEEGKRSHYPKYKVSNFCPQAFAATLDEAERLMHQDIKLRRKMKDDDDYPRDIFCYYISEIPMRLLHYDRECLFSCCEIFPPSEITDYLPDEPPTALCPYCHIDAVIGDASGFPITDEFLTEMKRRWFG